MDWRDPLDLYRAARDGNVDEKTFIQQLEEIQRRTSHVINPVASEGILNQPIIPVTKAFANLTIGLGATVVLVEESTIIYDSLTCEWTTSDTQGGYDTTPTLEVWCNQVFLGFLHIGAMYHHPGGKRWEIRNNSAVTTFQVTVYVRSIVSQDAPGKAVLAMGVGSDSTQRARPMEVSSNSGAVRVSFGNAAGDIAAGNSDLWLSSQETNEARGTLQGVGSPVNQNVAGPVGSTSLVCLALSLKWAALPAAPIGDVIRADWKFSGGSIFWTQRIDTLKNDGGDLVVFGVTGPKGNAGSSLQVSITHEVAGGADGWVVYALTRYITGF